MKDSKKIEELAMLLDPSEDDLPWLNSNENIDEKWLSISV